jgi:hypothetical protein
MVMVRVMVKVRVMVRVRVRVKVKVKVKVRVKVRVRVMVKVMVKVIVTIIQSQHTEKWQIAECRGAEGYLSLSVNKQNNMATIQWQFNKNEDNAISTTDESIVMYIEDINRDVVSDMVGLWNSGKTIKEIEKELSKDNRVTDNEIDYIIEQSSNWEKLNGTVTTENGAISAGVGVITDTIPYKSGIDPIVQTEEKLADVQKKAGTTKRAPRTAPVKQSTKMVSVEEIVAKMKEQILCIEYLNTISIDADEFPANVGKAAREVLIEFQKEIESTKNLAIAAIQQL